MRLKNISKYLQIILRLLLEWGLELGNRQHEASFIPNLAPSLCGNGGGGGSRTPVRKALRHEAYMLSSIPFCSPAALRMSKKRSRLVR